MKKSKKLLNNLYKASGNSISGSFQIEFLKGKFKGIVVKYINIHFDRRDFGDEKDVPVLVFDYELEHEVNYRAKTFELMDKLLLSILEEIVEMSIEHDKKLEEDRDRISDEAQ